MSDFILEARGIVKTFPGVRALDGVDLAIKRGEVHAIVGENGAGKSTLMMTLAGVYNPDSGSILIEGVPVSFSSPHDAVRKGISIVFQELSLVPSLSVAENIFVNRQPVGALGFIDRKRLHDDAHKALSLFDLGCVDPGTLVKNLSVASQQVVEILKAISTGPRVLILDEPTSSLTEIEAARLFENIERLAAKGIACVYISHHLNEIFRIADKVTILRDGRYVCSADVSGIDEDFLVANMVGRKLGDIYGTRSPQAGSGTVRLEVRRLCRAGAFSEVGFTVRRGEIVGLSGLVGAGRTEVARAIFGAEPPDSGDMYLDGQPVAPKSPSEAIAAGIGYLTEDRKSQGLYLDFPIRANLVANRLRSLSRGIYMDENLIDEDAHRAIRNYRIATDSAHKKVRTLSGGNQQKVLLGAWIGIGPRVLIVDEPTRGVDIGARCEIYAFLRELASRGTAILMISSDLSEILGLSDRIIVMKSGVVAGELEAAAATEQSVIALATGAGRGECI